MREHGRLVAAATFATEFEASLARGALEAIGIDAWVPAEDSGSFSRPGAPPVVTLQVFESDLEQAVVELRRLQMRVVEADEE
jgi:hypothetical protein